MKRSVRQEKKWRGVKMALRHDCFALVSGSCWWHSKKAGKSSFWLVSLSLLLPFRRMPSRNRKIRARELHITRNPLWIDNNGISSSISVYTTRIMKARWKRAGSFGRHLGALVAGRGRFTITVGGFVGIMKLYEAGELSLRFEGFKDKSWYCPCLFRYPLSSGMRKKAVHHGALCDSEG